jgi:hypothetical protein
MRASFKAAGCTIVTVLLALAPRAAGAQSNPFDRPDAPSFVTDFSGAQRAQEQEFSADFAFTGQRRVDRFDISKLERAQPWKFYGRLGPLNFQNQLEPVPQGLQFSWRRTGPSLGGRLYVGVHRTF